MHSGSLVFVGEPCADQMASTCLLDGVHFITFNATQDAGMLPKNLNLKLSLKSIFAEDLKRKLQFAYSNDSLAAQIAARAQSFAEMCLNSNAITLYVKMFLSKLSSLQSVQSSEFEAFSLMKCDTDKKGCLDIISKQCSGT